MRPRERVEREGPPEATRAEWKRCIGENANLRRAKRALRRRLRGVLREARAWKAEAVARGWTREERNRDASALKALRKAARERRRGEGMKDTRGES